MLDESIVLGHIVSNKHNMSSIFTPYLCTIDHKQDELDGLLHLRDFCPKMYIHLHCDMNELCRECGLFKNLKTDGKLCVVNNETHMRSHPPHSAQFCPENGAYYCKCKHS